MTRLSAAPPPQQRSRRRASGAVARLGRRLCVRVLRNARRRPPRPQPLRDRFPAKALTRNHSLRSFRSVAPQECPGRRTHREGLLARLALPEHDGRRSVLEGAEDARLAQAHDDVVDSEPEAQKSVPARWHHAHLRRAESGRRDRAAGCVITVRPAADRVRRRGRKQ